MQSRHVFCLMLFCAAGSLQAQQTSASMEGRVVDPQAAAVAGAKITLIDQKQGSTRTATTNSSGTFAFTPLVPSDYTLRVEAAGFSKLEQKDIKVFAADKIALPDIALAVGSVNETINVEASAVTLQTSSSERSGVVTGSQVVDLALNGRNYSGLLKTIVGFNGDTNNSNGRRTDTNNLIMDGVTTLDSGNNGFNLIALNTDAIAEVKVLTNSQQAEYGRTAGGSINIVTKSGGQQFHGNGYLFHRHEDLNANSFTNNYNGFQRPLYRFNTFGFTFGGPVMIPKVNFLQGQVVLLCRRRFYTPAGAYIRKRHHRAHAAGAHGQLFPVASGQRQRSCRDRPHQRQRPVSGQYHSAIAHQCRTARRY